MGTSVKMNNSNLDEIRIDNLEVYANHGVFPEETALGQTFYINAVLYMETRESGLTDNLSVSVNYGEVCHFMNDFMKKHTFKLIESVAEHLAEEVLLAFPLIKELDMEIRKPSAPVKLSFESISVKIRRGWHTAYVAIGSNMGNREEYVNHALKAMKENPKLQVVKTSDILRTSPYGGAATGEFLNGAVELKTLYTPEELLNYLQLLEQEAGRERKVRWGNRTLDLDIIFYDSLIMSTEKLTIPHQDMRNRDFVLKPLVQLNPYLMHPIFQVTVGMLLDKLEAKEK